ncbi:hypothetical protein XENOCAPTIV_021830 [Xenoophorus captivus]|uniref:Uncharacterized protein n=1 Tax=Xenoophorus captivus TaxID=1517983 RepID=A0ABV0RK78_9TELE
MPEQHNFFIVTSWPRSKFMLGFLSQRQTGGQINRKYRKGEAAGKLHSDLLRQTFWFHTLNLNFRILHSLLLQDTSIYMLELVGHTPTHISTRRKSVVRSRNYNVDNERLLSVSKNQKICSNIRGRKSGSLSSG